MYAVGDQVNDPARGSAAAGPPAPEPPQSGPAGPEPAQPAQAAPEPVEAGLAPRRWLPGWSLDAVALLSFAALAIAVLNRLWADPAGRLLRSNVDDHGIFLFLLAHGERVLFAGQHPFFTDRMNVPDGVNLMANTSILALSLPVAPLTHLAGPAVSMVLLLTLGLAGTAAAWYLVLSRHLVGNRGAAYVGGVWCGFAPAMVSHANGHINFVANFVVPFIVWRVLRLREPGRAVRNGLALAGLIVVQVFINEEILLFTAMATGIVVVGYAAVERAAAKAAARAFLTGLVVAAAASSVALAYPLWFQFFGPRHYRGLPFEPDDFVTDLASYPAFARLSLGGDPQTAQRLSVSPTEDNAFFGWPVLILLLVGLLLARRSTAVWLLTGVGLLFTLMSLGPTLVVGGTATGIPLPFAVLGHVPVLDLISVTRFAMVVTTVVGVLLALIVDRVAAGVRYRGRPGVRVGCWVLVGAALLPVAPRPLPVTAAPAVPPFFAAGLWRDHVPPGRSVVPVPLPEVTYGREGMRWAGLSHLEFPVPGGYFMGPADPPRDLTGAWSPAPRPTTHLLRLVATGKPAPVDDAARRAVVTDLRFWRAAVVVVAARPEQAAWRTTVTDLLGRSPREVGGVWLWDVRDLTAAAGN